MPVEILKKLPKTAAMLWESVFKTASAKYDDKRAARIAWAAVKKRFKKVDNVWVAKSSDFVAFNKVHYEFVADKASVAKSSEGYSFIEYVLSSSADDDQGQRFSGLALATLIEKINSEGLVGRLDIDHKEWYANKGVIDNTVDTGIRAIAAYKKGNKVIAKIEVRNDLLEEILKYRGTSVEAVYPASGITPEGTILQADFTGFVFTNNPSNPEAVRV